MRGLPFILMTLLFFDSVVSAQPAKTEMKCAKKENEACVLCIGRFDDETVLAGQQTILQQCVGMPKDKKISIAVADFSIYPGHPHDASNCWLQVFMVRADGTVEEAPPLVSVTACSGVVGAQGRTTAVESKVPFVGQATLAIKNCDGPGAGICHVNGDLYVFSD